MSGGSLPWFAHLLVVLAWHIQALAGPGSGYAWAVPGACRVGVRGCAQVAGQHARAARRVRRAAGGRAAAAALGAALAAGAGAVPKISPASYARLGSSSSTRFLSHLLYPTDHL